MTGPCCPLEGVSGQLATFEWMQSIAVRKHGIGYHLTAIIQQRHSGVPTGYDTQQWEVCPANEITARRYGFSRPVIRPLEMPNKGLPLSNVGCSNTCRSPHECPHPSTLSQNVAPSKPENDEAKDVAERHPEHQLTRCFWKCAHGERRVGFAERPGSGDGEREASMTQQMPYEQLPASVLFGPAVRGVRFMGCLR